MRRRHCIALRMRCIGGKLFGNVWGVALNDWLGTKRVQVNPAIVANLTGFQSLPFGDGLTFYGYGEDSTEHHFTGQERDQESGNCCWFLRSSFRCRWCAAGMRGGC